MVVPVKYCCPIMYCATAIGFVAEIEIVFRRNELHVLSRIERVVGTPKLEL